MSEILYKTVRVETFDGKVHNFTDVVSMTQDDCELSVYTKEKVVTINRAPILLTESVYA